MKRLNDKRGYLVEETTRLEAVVVSIALDVVALESAVAGLQAMTLDQVPAPIASVDFDGQQALSFRVENLTSDPASPAVGQIWLRVDL